MFVYVCLFDDDNIKVCVCVSLLDDYDKEDCVRVCVRARTCMGIFLMCPFLYSCECLCARICNRVNVYLCVCKSTSVLACMGLYVCICVYAKTNKGGNGR